MTDSHRVPAFGLVAVRGLGRLPALVAITAAAVGLGATAYFWRAGLTLAHYDAKAHLVVSRRILDSLTPGWDQVGAVWLPLPHLLNMLPAQSDFLYRTGAFAILVSIAANAVAAACIAGVVLALTSSRPAAALSAALYVANPNVLYLQSTPMTEPLFFGLVTFQVLLATRWVLSGRLTVSRSLGWVTVLACLTRYEAWPIAGAVVTAAAFAWWRRGQAVADVARVHMRLALYPVCTVLAFMAFSKITVDEWFVSGGFFVPDETLRGQPAVVLDKIAEGIRLLGGSWLLRFAVPAAALTTLLGLASAGRSPMLIPLALFAVAALPVSAYLAGHPFRMRYEVPLVIACAVAVGLGVGLLKRLAPVAALAVFVLVVTESRPFDERAPMVLEAQLDRETGGRSQVTECLRSRYDGTTIMVSMGALGHYMHELSAAGFAIRDFLHEGNGPIWDSAFTRGPAPLAGWVLVEEEAEGGDAIAQRARQYAGLLKGFERVCEGGNVALYQRSR